MDESNSSQYIHFKINFAFLNYLYYLLHLVVGSMDSNLSTSDQASDVLLQPALLLFSLFNFDFIIGFS